MLLFRTQGKRGAPYALLKTVAAFNYELNKLEDGHKVACRPGNFSVYPASNTLKSTPRG